MNRKARVQLMIVTALTPLILVMVSGIENTPLLGASPIVTPTATFTPTPNPVSPTPTNTPVPPTPTNTPVPPTPTPSNLPAVVTVDQSSIVVDEGQLATNGGSALDPDGTVVDIGASVGSLLSNTDRTWSWTFLPPDGLDDSQVVTIFATDDDEATSSATFSLIVNNVAPDVGPISVPTELQANGTPIAFTAVFTDPGTLDTHTAVLAWGDGGTCNTATDTDCSLVQGTGSGSVSGSHAYTAPGAYTVVLTVTDDDGGSSTSIYESVVVYDPHNSFVTGGGWIDSPPGAYKPDPSLTGKVTYGFVSRYKKGASYPHGNTQFQFKAADLNFHSDDYEWLIVNQDSTNAQFKGSGTINGKMGPNDEAYKFMLWATDGDPDTFRIKIWYGTGTEVIIYDNGSGQPVSGGNIKIHTK